MSNCTCGGNPDYSHDSHILAARIKVKANYSLGYIEEDDVRALALEPTSMETAQSRLKTVPGAKVYPAMRYVDPISGQASSVRKPPSEPLPEKTTLADRIRNAWRELTR